MARGAFLLLVLANLLFFVWAAGYLGGGDDGREPERLKAQVQPERIQLVGRDEPARPASPAPVAEAVPAPASTQAPVPPPAPEAAPDEKPAPPDICRRIGPLPKADADKIAAAIAAAGGKVARSSGAADGNIYWVHIPAAEATPADRKSAELRQAGVTDFFFASEGPNKGAISLGVFHREDAAKDMLRRMHSKGIEAARLEVRPKKADNRLLLDIRAPAELIERQLAGRRLPAADCPKE